MDESQHTMSEEDAQSLRWLIQEFGDKFGPEIFETIITEYKKLLPLLKPSFRYVSSVNNIIENILLCINSSIERAIASGDEKVAGDIASKNIMRKFYITLFISKYYELVLGKPKYKAKLTENIGKIREMLLPILFESQTNSNAWLCDKIDDLIEYNKLGFPEPPKTVLDEAKSAREAVTKIIEQRRMQEQMQEHSPDQMMTLGMTPIFPSYSSVLLGEEGEEQLHEQLDEKEVLRQEIREAILNIERSGKFDLNDPLTHNPVLLEIFNMPHFISIRSEDTPANRAKFDEISEIFYDDILSLLNERRSMPPPVVFSPGIFTPRQLEREEYAKQIRGWKHGLPRGASEFFPDPAANPGGFASGKKKGGNKKIKSKKNSKKYSNSKKHSTRRRRRPNSYKK